jgi:hypothetical protein
MEKSASFQKRWFFAFVLSAIGTLIVLFAQSGKEALLAMDAPPYQLDQISHCLEKGFSHTWFGYYWLGYAFSPISPDLNALIYRWTHFPFSLNLLFTFNFLLSGIGFYFLLERLKLNGPAKFFGGMAFLLASTNISLVYPGHINKIMTSAWIPFSVAFFFTALQQRRISDYLLSGAFLGLALLGGEVQIPYYLGLWFSAWIVIYLVLKQKTNKLQPLDISFHGFGIFILAGTSLLCGFTTTLHSLEYLGENTISGGTDDPAKLWHFATQFYFPPEEILSFITTTQFFGAPGVYWGRDGNPSPLRLSDDYMGLLPLGFALLGAVALWRLWQVRFFVIMGIVSLLASFGREGFVYWILYQLPTMKSQRNPHRWIYFVAFAVCALSAYGVHWFWEKLNSENPAEQNKLKIPSFSRLTRILSILGWIGIIVFGVAALFISNVEPFASLYYSKEDLGSPQKLLYLERTRLMLASLLRTGFFITLSSLSVWWIIYFRSKIKPHQPASYALVPFFLLVLVMVNDLGMNDKRFVIFYPWKERFENNDAANLIRKDPDIFRVKAVGLQENPEINELVSTALPIKHIQIVDPPATSRLATEYAQLFNYIGSHYMQSDRYYDFFNVKYLINSQKASDASTKFDLIAEGKNFFLFKRQDFMPRAWLAYSANIVGNPDDALAQTLSPSFPFRKSVVLEEKPDNLPTWMPTPNDNKSTTVHSVPFKLYDSNQIILEANPDKPAMLVLGDKWAPEWKAWVDDQPAKLFRANFLMRGVELSPGKHTIRMEYRPPMTGQYVSIISLLGVFAVTGLMSVNRRYRK